MDYLWLFLVIRCANTSLIYISRLPDYYSKKKSIELVFNSIKLKGSLSTERHLNDINI